VKPYYADDAVTLYLGDCHEVTEWLDADMLVTDPPYGIGWTLPLTPSGHQQAHAGIKNDTDTSARDDALALWGDRPALVFGSLRAAYPSHWKRMLVFEKPTVGSGLFGVRVPWLSNWEPIFLLGKWPDQTPSRGAVVKTRQPAASGYSGYTTRAGHPHAKPLDVMESLITACPPGVIADPFAGSGSTLVAAKQLGRKAIGVELDERYCEVTARRLSQGVLDFGRCKNILDDLRAALEPTLKGKP
jgi:site-specific DNA-methyltransferase (adenine-specific)